MKRTYWAPLVAVLLAGVVLVPTTFAVGEPGTTLYAQLTPNRFPAGQGSADASLTFNSERNIVLRISITGPAGTVNAVRVYVDGTCANPGEWVINRTAEAGQNGPFLTVASNSGQNTIQVNQLDVDRVREELDGNPNETFALMVARVINGQNYRTCTPFRTTPFPPITTTTATQTGTQTGTNTTRFTTRTVTTVIGTQTTTFTLTEPVTTTATTRTLTTVIGGTTTTLTLTGPATFTQTGIATSGFTSTVTQTGLTTSTVPTSTVVTSTGVTTSTSTGVGTTATVTAPVTTTFTSTFAATTVTQPHTTTFTTTGFVTGPGTTTLTIVI